VLRFVFDKNSKFMTRDEAQKVLRKQFEEAFEEVDGEYYAKDTRNEPQIVALAVYEIRAHGFGEVLIKIHEQRITDVYATKKTRLKT